MISKISLNKIACFKAPTVLETDKKVNLIYGLNGTGKSTLSDFCLKISDSKFKDCKIEGLNDDVEILVYNQTFIRENFFETESLQGIFTLSKENKEAETKIAAAEKEMNRISLEIASKEEERQEEEARIASKRKTAKDRIWEIKQNYTGGDRVLEFCLEGYRSDSNKLLDYVINMKKPENKPTKTIESLKEDVQALAGENAQKHNTLNPITFSSQDVENENLFKKEIVGNENSSVSFLINKLGNSDWVKDGLKYLPKEIETYSEVCPFCQESTISKQLYQSIKDYFDESYEADINSIKEFYTKYLEAIQAIPDKSIFETNPKYNAYKKDFELKYNTLLKVIEDNKSLIEGKLKSPSVSVSLISSENALKDVNTVIDSINKLIVEHNQKIEQKETSLKEIKTTFWELMRWEYDQTISSFASDNALSQSKIDAIDKSIRNFKIEIDKQKGIIVEQQKKTVNIEEAITNINNGLLDLGIEEFKIKHHSENLYKIVREQNDNRIFHSLSEGEKMVISFLYFLELCRGKKDATEAGKKKIIVIDDPISSLSHIYVFNVGRLIKNEFFGTRAKKNGETIWNFKYEQVFVLTHSLYFFYELTEVNHEIRKETQNLFRLTKNLNGSAFEKLSYESIQNDYQAYWQVIKDPDQHPALIANCMRNIIEYFFNFVEKESLNNVFQKPSMKENRFQAFCRYINRESHSLGQNIFDIKEFNYDDFKDAFALVFKENDYEEHYNKMMT